MSGSMKVKGWDGGEDTEPGCSRSPGVSAAARGCHTDAGAHLAQKKGRCPRCPRGADPAAEEGMRAVLRQITAGGRKTRSCGKEAAGLRGESPLALGAHASAGGAGRALAPPDRVLPPSVFTWTSEPDLQAVPDVPGKQDEAALEQVGP